MSSGRKAACCHWVPGLVFPPWCHHNRENHKYMLEFIEPENNTRDISLQNTLIAGSGRNTHLLLMGLRRVNVNLTLHSLDFYWVFIKKGFSGWISALECRKEGVRRKSHLLWGKVMEEPGQFPVQTSGSGKEKFLILQQGLLIRASSERKLPKISPKCSCPCGTPAVPLQKGPLSPEGYLYSTSWERHLGHHPGSLWATGVGTCPWLTAEFEKPWHKEQHRQRREDGPSTPRGRTINRRQRIWLLPTPHRRNINENQCRQCQKLKAAQFPSLFDPLVRAEPHPGPPSSLLWNQQAHHTQVLTSLCQGKQRHSLVFKTNYFFIYSLAGI